MVLSSYLLREYYRYYTGHTYGVPHANSGILFIASQLPKPTASCFHSDSLASSVWIWIWMSRPPSPLIHGIGSYGIWLHAFFSPTTEPSSPLKMHYRTPTHFLSYSTHDFQFIFGIFITQLLQCDSHREIQLFPGKNIADLFQDSGFGLPLNRSRYKNPESQFNVKSVLHIAESFWF